MDDSGLFLRSLNDYSVITDGMLKTYRDVVDAAANT